MNEIRSWQFVSCLGHIVSGLFFMFFTGFKLKPPSKSLRPTIVVDCVSLEWLCKKIGVVSDEKKIWKYFLSKIDNRNLLHLSLMLIPHEVKAWFWKMSIFRLYHQVSLNMLHSFQGTPYISNLLRFSLGNMLLHILVCYQHHK